MPAPARIVLPRRRAGAGLALALACFGSAAPRPGRAQDGHPGVHPGVHPAVHPGVTIPGSQQRTLRLPDGRIYRLLIWKPPGKPPAAGYPVIYFTNANAVFGTFAEALTLRSRRPDAQGILPAVLVGIGYPTDQPFDVVRRTYDLTPAVARDQLAPRPDGTPWPATGGADAFLAMIEQTVKPQVEHDFPIDRRRQVLFGHSFGGLFALHVLFSRPDAFQAYVAASPSIWFGAPYLLDEERRFAARARDKPPVADVLITMGAYEQDLSPAERRSPHAAERLDRKRRNRMVDNAREMAMRLAALSPAGLRVTFSEFAGEDHISVLPVLISRTLEFALRPSP